MFAIKKGAVLPILEATLQDEHKSPIILTDATQVLFRFRLQTPTNSRVIQGVAQIIEPTNGKVEYRWAPGDTKTPGEYYGEFKIIWNSGDIMIVPSLDYAQFEIVASL